MSSPATSDPHAGLPQGTWAVDPARSELRFSARGMFGLAKVTGRFTRYAGEFAVEGADAHGELRIEAGSLDTGNPRRDTHLRSKDFFFAEESPTVTFRLLGVTETSAGAEMAGELLIRQSRVAVSAPLTVESRAPDELELSADFDVDRVQAGVGWSRLGMIKGAAQLHGRIVLASSSPAA